MEQSEILDIENPIYLLTLHVVFTSRINTAFDEFASTFYNTDCLPNMPALQISYASMEYKMKVIHLIQTVYLIIRLLTLMRLFVTAEDVC